MARTAMTMLVASSTRAAASDETPAYTAALAAYVEDKLLGDKELARVIKASEQGSFANPFLREEAELDTAKWHAYETLQEWIGAGRVDAEQVCAWAKKTQADRAKGRQEREQTRDDTAVTWERSNLALGVGENVACGVQTDNTVVCWDGSQVLIPPSEIGEVLSISVSELNACVVRKDDQKVRCFHLKPLSESCKPGTWNGAATSVCGLELGAVDSGIPSDLGSVNSVSIQSWAACAIHCATEVICWSHRKEVGEARVPTDLGPARSIALGCNNRACAILASGEARCWDLFHNVYLSRSIPGLVNSVSPGGEFVCAVTQEGALDCYQHLYDIEFRITRNLGPLRSVSVGEFAHIICVLKMNGEVVWWNALFWGASQNRHEPAAQIVDGLAHSVSAGWHDACLVRPDGTVFCWSANAYQKALTPPEGLKLRVDPR